MKKNIIQIKFLGTGSNGGIPQSDCRCKNCEISFNKRFRSSILIKANDKTLIVDCGPDFRNQLIQNHLRLQDISFITLSHLHWDHCAGLFELSSGKVLSVPIVAHKILKEKIISNNMFGFLFERGWAKFSRPKLFHIDFIKVKHDPKFPTFATKITTFKKTILIATDIWQINAKFIKEARLADLIIFDGTFLTESKHWHIAINKSAKILSKVNRNVIFTHVNHSEDIQKISSFLDKFNFKLAFDGMDVKI